MSPDCRARRHATKSAMLDKEPDIGLEMGLEMGLDKEPDNGSNNGKGALPLASPPTVGQT
jgi:hypothetical protein